MKIPEPIMEPATIIVPSHNPRTGLKFVSEGEGVSCIVRALYSVFSIQYSVALRYDMGTSLRDRTEYRIPLTEDRLKTHDRIFFAFFHRPPSSSSATGCPVHPLGNLIFSNTETVGAISVMV